ncbi:hypothetical protein BTBSAS_200043 [Brochothrix thermosphacta]|uniref:Uncharacterized protein n=1 Tax=Brochothrix thermosphacta TaxID=2756 RepID=A0A2X0QIP5_BROTH|nr:hypothetical protein BTBSAS_200043 [Brochothrix thermosphacta]
MDNYKKKNKNRLDELLKPFKRLPFFLMMFVVALSAYCF